MAVNKCIKYLLFLFNLLFWISGCIILGVSIYLKVSKNGNVIMDEAVPFVDLLIAVGVIIMVLGFLGCCGAIKENRCMLILSQVWVKESLAKLLPLKDQKPEVQTDLQKLEVEAKCCGLINGPSDWGSTVPSSCDCVDTAQACQSANGRQVYSTPCVKFVTSFMEKNAIIALGIAFGIAVLMLFGMAFAMTLYCQIGKRDANTA
ncbi:tetraspanin-8 isoform X2 [Oncorhynchus kisutch]|uniref:tetraspanin-8 isoform X2 n=1 Tax=Oncorhynchus kisutch TaxID=8019 RepID=UPI0012DEA1CF|nr:tetraspanin-8 isoform X2 [Oncorhynchus kisutch]